MFKTNWNFQGLEGLRKIPSMEEAWIFSNCSFEKKKKQIYTLMVVLFSCILCISVAKKYTFQSSIEQKDTFSNYSISASC